jgi:uncharacterized membrane protein YqjE
VSYRERKNGAPASVTSIPLVDPHALPPDPSIGDLVKDATAQMSTLLRAEVELAKVEITRDVKKGLTGSVYFILAMVVLLYSTFFMFFFLAELLDTWLWRWASFLIVFILMLLTTAVFALLGYRKVHRIRGPQETIASVRETTSALSPSNLRGTAGATAGAGTALTTSDPAVAYEPATDPAVTYGAVTYESATDPAVTYGAVTYESASEPAVNDPAVTYPRATDPRATDPPGWG